MALTLSSLRLAGRAFSPTMSRIVAALLSIAILAWAGARVSRASAARRGELKRAEATLATFAEWRRRFQPAVAAESIAWRRTLMELQSLGVLGDERLALTRAVGRAAEAAGLRDVKVIIDLPDTTGSDARLSTEGVRRQSAPFGLVVECRGNLQAIVTFLGELPPSVAPTDLNLVRQDGRARHRLSLAVYELQLSNGSAILASPLERSATRRIGIGRIGG
jgi:hypothetical protein